MATLLPIQGSCDARFAALREAFAANFRERGEVGAAVAVYLDGRPVVDLWSGWADVVERRPWRADTLVNVFSVGKGLISLCAHRLVERGRLELDTPLTRWWPQIGAAGKEALTLRHLLSHRAGLPAIAEPLPEDAMLDWQCIVSALERQTPWWPIGSDHGYHVNTFGFLLGELVRRVEGETMGKVLRRQLAVPLAADIHLGLPEKEQRRVAEFFWTEMPPPPLPSVVSDDDRMRWLTYFNPAGISGAGGWVNDRRWRQAELPSTNVHGTARGVARVYAALAAGGELDGVRVLGRDALAAARVEHSSGFDRITQRPSRFALGFQLAQPERPLGPNRGAFGHFGAGGSLGFCDPAAGVAFAYVMNEMGPRWQNPRNRALVDALYSSI